MKSNKDSLINLNSLRDLQDAVRLYGDDKRIQLFSEYIEKQRKCLKQKPTSKSPYFSKTINA